MSEGASSSAMRMVLAGTSRRSAFCASEVGQHATADIAQVAGARGQQLAAHFFQALGLALVAACQAKAALRPLLMAS